MTTETSPFSVIVRSYQPSDLPACQAIFMAVHRSYDHLVVHRNLVLQTDMADIEKNYLQISNGHWWVAVSTDDNQVVGHIAVLPLSIAELSYYHELPEGERDQVCELRRMAVAFDVQRTGIGSKLLSTLINFAREKGYRQIHLTTLTNMNKACAFYERNGFTKGRVEKLPFDDVSLEKSEDTPEMFRNPVKPVIFEVDDIIPDDDLRFMKMLPAQTKRIYLQHYSLNLQ